MIIFTVILLPARARGHHVDSALEAFLVRCGCIREHVEDDRRTAEVGDFVRFDQVE